jgi:hypothetical protein
MARHAVHSTNQPGNVCQAHHRCTSIPTPTPHTRDVAHSTRAGSAGRDRGAFNRSCQPQNRPHPDAADSTCQPHPCHAARGSRVHATPLDAAPLMPPPLPRLPPPLAAPLRACSPAAYWYAVTAMRCCRVVIMSGTGCSARDGAHPSAQWVHVGRYAVGNEAVQKVVRTIYAPPSTPPATPGCVDKHKL